MIVPVHYALTKQPKNRYNDPMELHPKSKILFLALAACITFSHIFTLVLTASILDHDCIREENCCLFCLQIKMTKIFLKTLKMAAIIVFLALFFMNLVQQPQKYTEFATYPLSTITLKVRFNA
jgi:hypothetical protein